MTKTIKAKSKIGAGLFTDDLLDVRVEFDEGWVVLLKVMPMTQDLIVGLENEGVKFSDYASNSEALENSSRIFNAIVVEASYIDPAGEEHELEGNYKNRLMQLPDVMAGIFEAAMEHGSIIAKDDEGNSES